MESLNGKHNYSVYNYSIDKFTLARVAMRGVRIEREAMNTFSNDDDDDDRFRFVF